MDLSKKIRQFAWNEPVEELEKKYVVKKRYGCWCCTVPSEKTKTCKGTELQTKIRQYLRQCEQNPNMRNFASTPVSKEMIAENKASERFNLEAHKKMVDHILAMHNFIVKLFCLNKTWTQFKNIGR